MHRPLHPITEMLIREIKEVRTLIADVQDKLANVDIDEEIRKSAKEKKA